MERWSDGTLIVASDLSNCRMVVVSYLFMSPNSNVVGQRHALAS